MQLIVFITLLSVGIPTARSFFRLPQPFIDDEMAWKEASSGTIGGKRRIRSFHGTFLRTRHSLRGAVTVGLAMNRNVCEQWIIENFGEKVTIKSYCSFGGFLRANEKGHVDITDRLVDEALWTPIKNGDGTWSLRNDQGRFLSARLDGTVRTVKKCYLWEHFWIDAWNRA